ncbi:unnamed protein product [Blepharisma stoltei]|uniref:Hemoglobin n=1 Tax=Blepharisma stoltei TaxID=1481888 RepID=A0AAU9IYS0_9CILI|nr:unnamed protein product [Blepharisma stoltei]
MYYRYGDTDFWSAVVNDFHEKIRSDPLLRRYFCRRSQAEVQMINFAILKAGLGLVDSGYEDVVKYAHQSRGIRKEHLDRFFICLKSALDQANVLPEDAETIIANLSNYSSLLIDETSSEGVEEDEES